MDLCIHCILIFEIQSLQLFLLYKICGCWDGYDKTLPRSSIGKAMRYAVERWEELGNYMKDGNLEIDNNLIENAIRPVALGRKNYLFAGSHHGAHRGAIMYTFMSQCKAHEVNPFKWLKYVLENIMDTKPSEYYKLLPAYIKNNPDF